MTELRAGVVVAGRYTVEAVIGRGGMATVYQVMHHQLGTPCALKVLSLSAHSVKGRLLQEGHVQAALAHPNVVSVIDVVDVAGSPGLVMELVRGPSLELLLAHDRMTLAQCDALADGLFAGLGAAHNRGLIHRDLKPANILCAVNDGGLVPKVTDFGLAKLLGEESGASNANNTRSGTTMGTPAYMAPEQIRNAKNVDQRADVFSLGAVLYEIVTGVQAFGGTDDLLDIFTRVASGTYTPPAELRPEIPARMALAIRGALEPDRELRIRDCQTLRMVWEGEREEWTSEVEVVSRSGGPWDKALIAKFQPRGPAPSLRSGSPLPKSLPSGGDPYGNGAESTPVASDSLTYAEAPNDLPRRARVTEPSISLPPGSKTLAVLLGGMGLVGAVGAVLLVALGVALWTTLRPADELPPPIEASATPPDVDVPVLTPVEVPVVEPAPAEPTVVEEEEPVVAVVERPRPAPVAPVVVPDPEPIPPPAPVIVEVAPAPVVDPRFVRVTLTGDVSRVYLQSASGNTPLPATVLPGTYQVQAFFDSGTPVSVGEVTLVAGRDKALSCSKELRKCK